MAFDIEEVIYQTNQSHTKKSKEDDIGFLSVEECIIDPSHIFEEIRKSDHQSHDKKKNTTSHSRCTFFMFMELGEYLRLFSGNCCLTDGFAEFIFFEDADIYRIQYPCNKKGDQSKYDDIIQFYEHEWSVRHKNVIGG